MSRKNNRRRRSSRRLRKKAWEEFHATYPDTGGNMPVFALVQIAKSNPNLAKKMRIESEMENFGFNQIQKRKNNLEQQFKSCWRQGVDSLDTEGWSKTS